MKDLKGNLSTWVLVCYGDQDFGVLENNMFVDNWCTVQYMVKMCLRKLCPYMVFPVLKWDNWDWQITQVMRAYKHVVLQYTKDSAP